MQPTQLSMTVAGPGQPAGLPAGAELPAPPLPDAPRGAARADPGLLRNLVRLAKGWFFLLVFLVYFSRYEGPARSYWDTFVSMPASHLVSRPVEFVDEQGAPLFRFSLPGRLPQNLVDPSTFGIISKDQRLGAPVVHAPWFLLFNLLGFRLCFSLCGTALAVAGYAAGRFFFGGALSLFLAALLSLNPYVLTCTQLSPSLTGAAILALLLVLLLRGRTHGLLTGLLYGAALAVLEVSLLLLPAVLFRLRANRTKASHYLYFFLGVLLVFAPLLYWNDFAYGGILNHPTQHADFAGHRPTFPHRFLWWTFPFNGLLNFPFHHTVVRTPHFPFPGFIFIPLVFVRSFGIPLLALLTPGLVRFWKVSRQTLLFLLLWGVPFAAFLLVQENLDEWKISYVLVLMPPLCLLLTQGLASLFASPGRRRSLLCWAGSGMVVLTALLLLRTSDFPLDERWYVRFPKALSPENRGVVLRDEERLEWYIYHTAETPEEYRAQKAKMTAIRLFPTLYIRAADRPAGLLPRLRQEWETDRIRTPDMWETIYGVEPHRVRRR